MENSRFITYPSKVEKEDNHTVILIGASMEDVEGLGLFCKFSKKNYDVYLYKDESNNLEYLSDISDSADQILINDSSKIDIKGENILRFGTNSSIKQILDYFNVRE